MTSEQSKKIKKLMIDKEISAAEIGRKHNVTRQSVVGVINGQWRSLRIERAIARALSVRYSELWGVKPRSKKPA